MVKASSTWNLKVINPQLCNSWHPVKNGNLYPECVTPKSGQKVWWVCEKNHEWEATIHSRSKGTGCPYCAGKKCSETNSLLINFPKIANEWDYNKNNVLLINISYGSTKKYWWICKNGHSWNTSPNNRTGNNCGCPYCARQICVFETSLGNTHKHLANEWHPKNKPLTPYDVSSGSDKKVWWICKKGHEWQATISGRKSGRNCPYCSKRISNACSKWLNNFHIDEKEKYFFINNRKFWVDGFNSKNNIIYEFLGDYWHGNPKVFNLNETNKTINKTFKYLYDKTFEKFDILIDKGFRVIYKWESEKNNIEYKRG